MNQQDKLRLAVGAVFGLILVNGALVRTILDQQREMRIKEIDGIDLLGNACRLTEYIDDLSRVPEPLVTDLLFRTQAFHTEYEDILKRLDNPDAQ